VVQASRAIGRHTVGVLREEGPIAQRDGRVSSTYPAGTLLGLARSTALVWHTQIPELASLFPPDRRDRRDTVVRVVRQILEQ
jgi:hypothetical protein